MERILIVDDDEAFWTFLASAVRLLGYDVVEVQNGAEAIRRLKETTFLVIMTDIFMPAKDGFEVISEIRQLNPLARIIAMSGASDDIAPNVSKVAKLLGAQRVLSKPFTLADLKGAINEIADK